MAENTKPEYGASEHYLNDAGAEYFNAQVTFGELSARWNLNLWLQWVNAQDRILDFGCGSGALLALLPGMVKMGVEINPAARQHARLNGVEVYPSLDDLQDQTFTKIISSHALEHIPNPYTLLSGLRDFLDPAGTLLLLLPLDDWRARQNRDYQPGEYNRHLFTWTPQNIGNLLEEAGYRSIEVKMITDAMLPNVAFTQFAIKSQALRGVVGNLMARIYLRRQIFARAGK